MVYSLSSVVVTIPSLFYHTQLQRLVRFSLSYVLFPSYKPDGKYCHVPHDSVNTRATLVGVKGITQAGYTAYVMEDNSRPLYNATVSKTNSVYWLGDTVQDLGLNAELTGIETAEQCYEACWIVNDGPCWLFKYVIMNPFIFQLCNNVLFATVARWLVDGFNRFDSFFSYTAL